MTRFGNFFNFLATNFLTKVAQIFNDFLGYFENIKFYVKIAVPTFLGNYVKIWASFYSNIWSYWSDVICSNPSNGYAVSTQMDSSHFSVVKYVPLIAVVARVI